MAVGLFDRITAPASLLAAWRSVHANHGGPGVDQVSLGQFAADLSANLERLRQDLRSGQYLPLPPRPACVLKADGRYRNLGILAVGDRVVQRAVLDHVDLLFERVFADCSHGYRRGRSVQTALCAVSAHRRTGAMWTVDADIKDCFASLDQALLLRSFAEVVPDRAVLRLVSLWLRVGILAAAPPATWLAGVLAHAERTGARLRDLGLNALQDLIRRPANTAWVGAGTAEGDDAVMGSPVGIAASESERVQRLAREVLLFVLSGLPEARWLRHRKLLLAGGGLVAALAAVPYLQRLQLRCRPRGVVQGAPMAPLLANVYLHRLDLRLLDAGLRPVRYADDLVLLCDTRAQATKALHLLVYELHRLRLRPNPTKTRILSPEEPLHFLGQTMVGPEGARLDTTRQPPPVALSVAAGAVQHGFRVVKGAWQKLGRARKTADLDPASTTRYRRPRHLGGARNAGSPGQPARACHFRGHAASTRGEDHQAGPDDQAHRATDRGAPGVCHRQGRDVAPTQPTTAPTPPAPRPGTSGGDPQ